MPAAELLLGVQTPQIVHLPPDVHSLDAAQEAIEFAESYGLEQDDSQRFTLEAGMGTRADETWAASEVGHFGPRQSTGKTDTVIVRELWGLFVGGEKLQIHSAHEFPTANEAFLRTLQIIDAFDDLRKHMLRPRFANGEQAILMRSGARLLYRARTSGNTRGFSDADLIVADEGQEAKREHLAASAPATLVNRNSQLWFSGSGGMSWSELAWDMRLRAIRGDAGRLAYVEHTAEQLEFNAAGKLVSTKPDNILDHEVWALANPGFGTRVTVEGLTTMYNVLGPEKFARECLCIWDPLPDMGHGGPISVARWNELVDEDMAVAVKAGESPIVGAWSWAIDVSPDLKWSSIAAAGMRADGALHVEVVRRLPGTEWVVPFAIEKYAAVNVAPRISGTSPGAFLVSLLEEAHIPVVSVGAAEVTQASARFIAAVDSGKLRHLGNLELPAAISNATIAQRGDSMVWSRVKSSGDISSLVAASIAVGGVSDAGGGGEWFAIVL
jgi:hypothetical protein